jgi:glucose-1-phosphate cytidylyltransferase
VTVVDTGEQTMTGGRLLRVRDYIQNEAFCFTYGDGVSDVNIRELVAFHQRQGKQATVTAVQPQSRYGALRLDARNFVEAFEEKPYGEGAWINGGFFVLEPTVLKLITDDTTVWERGPLETLAHSGQLTAHKHHGFWQPMDTLREKTLLENLWAEGNAPWKVW